MVIKLFFQLDLHNQVAYDLRKIKRLKNIFLSILKLINSKRMLLISIISCYEHLCFPFCLSLVVMGKQCLAKRQHTEYPKHWVPKCFGVRTSCNRLLVCDSGQLPSLSKSQFSFSFKTRIILRWKLKFINMYTAPVHSGRLISVISLPFLCAFFNLSGGKCSNFWLAGNVKISASPEFQPLPL